MDDMLYPMYANTVPTESMACTSISLLIMVLSENLTLTFAILVSPLPAWCNG